MTAQEPSFPAIRPSPPRREKTLLWGLSHTVCRCLAAGLFDLRFSGAAHVPRRGGALLLSNHQSFLDPVMLALPLPRPIGYMARANLFDVPVFGRLIRQLNAFPVRRGEGDVAAIREAIRRLREGRIITVFPEGTRTRDGEIGPLEPGVAMIARRAGVPVVPAVIDGAWRAWPRHRKWPRPWPIRVAYGPPLDLTGLNAHEILELIARTLRDMLRALRAADHRAPR